MFDMTETNIDSDTTMVCTAMARHDGERTRMMVWLSSATCGRCSGSWRSLVRRHQKVCECFGHRASTPRIASDEETCRTSVAHAMDWQIGLHSGPCNCLFFARLAATAVIRPHITGMRWTETTAMQDWLQGELV